MTLEEKVDEIQQDVRAIKQELKGYNGEKGLCREHAELKKAFYNFRLWSIIALITIAGSSGISVYSLIGMLAK